MSQWYTRNAISKHEDSVPFLQTTTKIERSICTARIISGKGRQIIDLTRIFHILLSITVIPKPKRKKNQKNCKKLKKKKKIFHAFKNKIPKLPICRNLVLEPLHGKSSLRYQKITVFSTRRGISCMIWFFLFLHR